MEDKHYYKENVWKNGMDGFHQNDNLIRKTIPFRHLTRSLETPKHSVGGVNFSWKVNTHFKIAKSDLSFG